MGEIKGRWLSEELKVEILGLVGWAQSQGVSMHRSCLILAINRCRVIRWRKKLRDRQGLGDARAGHKDAPHRLLDEEREAVLSMASEAQYGDLAHRILAVKAWDMGLFFVSFSSVYRILKAGGMMSMRGVHRAHNGRSVPPVRKDLTGPNQRWCWDISYLLTYEKGLFLYLYLLLDEYSRKAIRWLVSWHQSAEEARRLIEGGLIAENILELPEQQRPEIISDRGRQMKAKSIRRIFEDHHMPQLFARPRTPNDNPFVESAFGTAKCVSQYPGRFLDCQEATAYFDKYFPWYNTQHLHSGIDYVTPEQCHQGLRETIVAQRRQKLQQHRRWRKEVNRSKQIRLINTEESLMPITFHSAACSVIPP